MFELGGELAVGGDHGPPIVLGADRRAALIEHGFYGEGHALLKHHARSGTAEMQHLGRLVHLAADAVAAVLAHHRIAGLLRMALDGVTDVAQTGAGADGRDAPPPARVPLPIRYADREDRKLAAHIKISLYLHLRLVVAR